MGARATVQTHGAPQIRPKTVRGVTKLPRDPRYVLSEWPGYFPGPPQKSPGWPQGAEGNEPKSPLPAPLAPCPKPHPSHRPPWAPWALSCLPPRRGGNPAPCPRARSPAPRSRLPRRQALPPIPNSCAWRLQARQRPGLPIAYNACAPQAIPEADLLKMSFPRSLSIPIFKGAEARKILF